MASDSEIEQTILCIVSLSGNGEFEETSCWLSGRNPSSERATRKKHCAKVEPMQYSSSGEAHATPFFFCWTITFGQTYLGQCDLGQRWWPT